MTRFAMLAAFAAFLLPGCENIVPRAQDANDRAAELLIKGPCQAPFGAVLRRPDNEVQGATLICDPDANRQEGAVDSMNRARGLK